MLIKIAQKVSKYWVAFIRKCVPRTFKNCSIWSYCFCLRPKAKDLGLSWVIVVLNLVLVDLGFFALSILYQLQPLCFPSFSLISPTLSLTFPSLPPSLSLSLSLSLTHTQKSLCSNRMASFHTYLTIEPKQLFVSFY